MWIRIRAVIIEDEPLATQYLSELPEDTCQVEVVGSAIESEAGLRLCAELRPDAVFVDINLPGKDDVSLATQLAMLPQPPSFSGRRCAPSLGNEGNGREGPLFNYSPMELSVRSSTQPREPAARTDYRYRLASLIFGGCTPSLSLQIHPGPPAPWACQKCPIDRLPVGSRKYHC
jgi:CheY-like chemotaxis protein